MCYFTHLFVYITQTDDSLTDLGHCVDNHKTISLCELKLVAFVPSNLWVNGYTYIPMTVICTTICSSIANKAGHVKTIIYIFLSCFLSPLLWFSFRVCIVFIFIAFLTISVFLLLLFFCFYLFSLLLVTIRAYHHILNLLLLSPTSLPTAAEGSLAVENKLQKLQKISHLWKLVRAFPFVKAWE